MTILWTIMFQTLSIRNNVFNFIPFVFDTIVFILFNDVIKSKTFCLIKKKFFFHLQPFETVQIRNHKCKKY